MRSISAAGQVDVGHHVVELGQRRHAGHGTAGRWGGSPTAVRAGRRGSPADSRAAGRSAGPPGRRPGRRPGAGAPRLFAAGGAALSPTTTSPVTEPVTGANPLRSGSSAARLQLILRVPAFQDSSVTLSQYTVSFLLGDHVVAAGVGVRRSGRTPAAGTRPGRRPAGTGRGTSAARSTMPTVSTACGPTQATGSPTVRPSMARQVPGSWTADWSESATLPDRRVHARRSGTRSAARSAAPGRRPPTSPATA